MCTCIADRINDGRAKLCHFFIRHVRCFASVESHGKNFGSYQLSFCFVMHSQLGSFLGGVGGLSKSGLTSAVTPALLETDMCTQITFVEFDLDGAPSSSSSSSSDGNIVNDKSWSSVRPQDLEGELSQPIYVRDGSFDFDNNNSKSKSETRIAAASTITTAEKKSSSLSRHNLAEVVVQCSLRLITTTTAFDDDGFVSGNDPSPIPGVRVVRVSQYPNNNDSKNNLSPAELDERPNADYFSRTGGNIAKAAAGTVTSVDWIETLQCFEKSYNSGRTKTIVKMFPKRPDM